jgi:hypothetical protein
MLRPPKRPTYREVAISIMASAMRRQLGYGSRPDPEALADGALRELYAKGWRLMPPEMKED